MFICDFGVKDNFLSVITQRFSCVIDFTAVDPLAVNEFPDLCDELAGPILVTNITITTVDNNHPRPSH